MKTNSFQCIGEIYTSEKRGCDAEGMGSEASPYKTVLRALREAKSEPWPVIYVDAKEGNVRCSSVSFRPLHRHDCFGKQLN